MDVRRRALGAVLDRHEFARLWMDRAPMFSFLSSRSAAQTLALYAVVKPVISLADGLRRGAGAASRAFSWVIGRTLDVLSSFQRGTAGGLLL